MPLEVDALDAFYTLLISSIAVASTLAAVAQIRSTSQPRLDIVAKRILLVAQVRGYVTELSDTLSRGDDPALVLREIASEVPPAYRCCLELWLLESNRRTLISRVGSPPTGSSGYAETAFTSRNRVYALSCWVAEV